MAKIYIDDSAPELPDDTVRQYRDFHRVESRYKTLSQGFRKKKLYRYRNRYYFFVVLLLLLLLVWLFS